MEAGIKQEAAGNLEPAAPTKPEGRDKKIKALVLAAGRGSRMGSAGQMVPKCLLQIGRRHLIEHQLDALADAGIGPTTMVVGYSAHEICEVVGMRAEYVVNKRWDATNSLYSFWVAREAIQGPLVILNSDVLFSPEILERLMEREGDVIAIDSSSGSAREQMKVHVHGDRLLDMRKDLPLSKVCGENVGILKFSAETVRSLFAKAEEMISTGDEKSWLGAAVRALTTTHDIRVVDVAGLPWVEIDFPTDLQKARKEVWPALQKGPNGSRAPWKAALWAAALFLIVSLAGVVSPSFFDSPPQTWVEQRVHGVEEITVQIREREQTWWRVGGHDSATVKVTGSAPVRLESRLLDPTGLHAGYVLEVRIDGAALDWFKLSTRVSKTAHHPAWSIGRRKRVTLNLPPGQHEISVRLLAPTDAQCLIRVRQPELPEGE